MMTMLPTNDLNLSNLDQKIPKIIWQTAKSFPHRRAYPLIQSWISKNVDYEWLFMDDARCDAFIKDNFQSDFYAMYKALPYGVMRADVWRVCVVYAYGGIYVDTDCECVVPINQWINGYSLIVSEEVENGDICNFAFAATPRHPALLYAINKFMELYNSEYFMLKDSVSPIQNFGQYGFSEGIKQYIKEFNNNDIKLFKYDEHRFTNGYKTTTYIAHLVASLSWTNYNSWRKDEKDFLSETD